MGSFGAGYGRMFGVRAGTAVLQVSDVHDDGCAKWKVRFGAAAMQWIIAVTPENPSI